MTEFAALVGDEPEAIVVVIESQREIGAMNIVFKGCAYAYKQPVQACSPINQPSYNASDRNIKTTVLSPAANLFRSSTPEPYFVAMKPASIC